MQIFDLLLYRIISKEVVLFFISLKLKMCMKYLYCCDFLLSCDFFETQCTPPWARDRENSFTFEPAASQSFQWKPANLSLSRWRIISHRNVPVLPQWENYLTDDLWHQVLSKSWHCQNLFELRMGSNVALHLVSKALDF